MLIRQLFLRNAGPTLLAAMGVLMLLNTSVIAENEVMRSYLGNKSNIDDTDTYSFMGVAGEEVWFRAQSKPELGCFASGETLKLVLKDKINDVTFREVASGSEPEIGPITLPASGEYRVLVKQDKNEPLEDRYNGLYILSSEGKDMTPLLNVESIVSLAMGCHENTKVVTNLGNENVDDRDTFRFYGRAGETVKLVLLYSDLCPAPVDRYVDFTIKATKKCDDPNYEERLIVSGPPEMQVDVPRDGGGFPSSCDYKLIVNQDKDRAQEERYSGLYEIEIRKNDHNYADYNVELQALKNVEPSYAGGNIWYRDSDGDTYGAGDDFICAENPPGGYVNNNWDCDDEDSNRHLLCELTAFTNCALPYRQTCLEPISGVERALDELAGLDLNKDKFTWPENSITPGDWFGKDDNKRHLQSIQHFNQDEVEGDTGKANYLAISMSDEHNNQANINLVKLLHIGSEKKPHDHVVYQYILTKGGMQSENNYNHPGGSQRIGEYLFLALEDFQTFSLPMVGVWKILREPNTHPKLRFMYLIDLYKMYPGTTDYHSSTVGITKLDDGTYLLAACIKGEGCNNIVFLKSTKTSLEGDPNFRYVDEWERDYWDTDHWSECSPQNMNLTVDDIDGSIYMTLFGNDKNSSTQTCGAGDAPDYIFNYRLGYSQDGNMDLDFVSKNYIQSGDACDSVLGVKIWATGTNFEAGAGFWIKPQGGNRLSVLATEHYNSCGKGRSRWGVSENWKWSWDSY